MKAHFKVLAVVAKVQPVAVVVQPMKLAARMTKITRAACNKALIASKKTRLSQHSHHVAARGGQSVASLAALAAVIQHSHGSGIWVALSVK